MGQREDRRRETREAILTAASRLFREHGYDATTIEMISATAGVSPRTFFRYFEAKDGVLTHVGFGIVERVLDRLTDEPSTAELIRQLATVFEASLEEERFRQAIAMFRENPHLIEQAAIWRERFATQLAEGIAALAGQAPATLRQRVKASVAIHAVAACADEWLVGDDESANVVDLAEVAVDALHGG